MSEFAVFPAIIERQDDDLDVVIGSLDASSCLDAIDSAHGEVHQDQLRTQAYCHFHSSLPGIGLPDHVGPTNFSQELLGSHAKRGAVVDQHDIDHDGIPLLIDRSGASLKSGTKPQTGDLHYRLGKLWGGIGPNGTCVSKNLRPCADVSVADPDEREKKPQMITYVKDQIYSIDGCFLCFNHVR